MKILNRLNTSFRNKQEITLNFDNSRIHALVGQNCSGKTYVLKTIALEFSGSYHRLSSAGLSKNVETIPWSVAQEQVQSDGGYLCNVLSYLSEKAPNDFSFLQNYLARIIPNIEAVSLHHFEKGTEIQLKTKSIACIRQPLISNGCLLTLGVLTILFNPRQPNLILIDDIDQGLHSTAQRELIKVIKEIVESKPELQIIVSTHSPYVVDKLTQSQVHALRSSETGEINCKRLDEHPDAGWAKQNLTTGEFWDAVGEDW
jgi:predicted ATP-dependent endonuclease of OLD family